MEGVVMRWVGLFTLLPLLAWADTPTDGVGRISIGGGLRWTPNDYFSAKAAEAGRGLISGGTAPFGPQAHASFGYGAFEWFEVAIDVFGAYESFSLDGWLPFNSISYGLLVGGRVTRYDVLIKGLVPYAGIQTGLLLSQVTSPSSPGSERALQPLSLNAGAAFRFTERFGAFVDARWMLGRVFVADIAGRNVGGVFLSVGVSIFFPAQAKRDLEVPGFGAPNDRRL